MARNNKNELLRWSGSDSVSFAITKSEMRLFEDLNITGECATEDKATGKDGYKSIKNSKPYKVTLNALLYAALKVDVKNVAMKMVKAAHKGESGYIYLGKNKLFTPTLILTKAQVSDIEMLPNGTWTGCKVALTFEQGEAGDGAASDPQGGSGKRYYGYALWNGTRWKVSATPQYSASRYTLDVTIDGKLYHGLKLAALTPPTTPSDDENPYGSYNQYD